MAACLDCGSVTKHMHVCHATLCCAVHAPSSRHLPQFSLAVVTHNETLYNYSQTHNLLLLAHNLTTCCLHY